MNMIYIKLLCDYVTLEDKLSYVHGGGGAAAVCVCVWGEGANRETKDEDIFRNLYVSINLFYSIDFNFNTRRTF